MIGSENLGLGSVPTAGNQRDDHDAPVETPAQVAVVTANATLKLTGRNPAPSASISIDPIRANGTTDDTAALMNWFASVPANQGADVQLPCGSVKLSASIAIPRYVTLRGRGTAATKLLATTAHNGSILTLTNTWANRILDLTIDSQTQRTAGAAIVVEGGNSSIPLSGIYPLNANQTCIQRVDMDNQFTGLVVQNVVGPPLSTPWQLDVSEGRWRIDAGYGIDLNATTAPGALKFGATHRFSDLFIYGNPISSVTGAAYRVRGSGDFRFTRCDAFGCYRALMMDPGAGAWVTTGRFTDCFFDSAIASVAHIAPDAAVTAFGDIAFTSCWFASSTQEHGLYLASAKASNIRGVNCIFIRNNIFGLVLAAGCLNNDFTGCVFSSNTVGGWIATGAASRFNIVSSRHMGDYGVGVAAAQPLAGQIDLGCIDYVVALNQVSQCAGGLVDNGGAVNKYVAGNI